MHVDLVLKTRIPASLVAGAEKLPLDEGRTALSHACVGVVPLCRCQCHDCVCVCVRLSGQASDQTERQAGSPWSKQKAVNYVITLENMAAAMARKLFEQIIKLKVTVFFIADTPRNLFPAPE